MNDRTRYHQSTQALLRTRPPGGKPTPDQLEENLRWLIALAVPTRKAPDRLRQRVRALGEAHRAWVRSRQVSLEALRRWPGLDELLAEPERDLLGLLLTSDVGRLAPDPELYADVHAVTERLMAALPDPLREVLLLQVVQRLSIPEIAQVLGYSEEETCSLLQQARASIFQQAQRDIRPPP